MLELIFDMETQDPDDFLTLLLLLDHPRVRLKAITITPGSAAQVGLVRRALQWFDRDLPVGAFNLDHPKPCVSSWHEQAWGAWEPSRDAAPGWELLAAHWDARTTLLTGAPLKNLGQCLQQRPTQPWGPWVAQGGFAGDNLIPPARQLEKFRGMTTCPTFNLNGDPKAALAALAHPGIPTRHFVSKNVCHGVIYDQPFHDRLAPLRHQRQGLWLIWQGMERYLQHQRVPQGEPPGKKLHDPLAACCAIDRAIGQWAQVELYRERGQWGARPLADSNTWIITGYDPERFFQTFVS